LSILKHDPDSSPMATHDRQPVAGRKTGRQRIPSRMDPPGWNLSVEQAMFIHYYFGECGGNATDACRRLGYANPQKKAHQLVNHPAVRAAIREKLDSCCMQVEEVLYRQTEVARADMDDFFTYDPKSRSLRFDYGKAQARGKTHLIKKLKFTIHGIEVELHDAMAAQERLMRHHGAFNDSLTVSVDLDNTPDDLLEAFVQRRISIDQLPRKQAVALPHASGPDDDPPLTIDGAGLVHPDDE
jgi:hypothetical protein